MRLKAALFLAIITYILPFVHKNKGILKGNFKILVTFICLLFVKIIRTMRIREGDLFDNSLTLEEKFAIAVHSILKRYKNTAR